MGPVPASVLAGGWPPAWWVGCHGGSGASTIAQLTGIGVDLGAWWPQWQPEWPMADVWLVCRASATGTAAATGVVDQWRRRAIPSNVRVRGLVAVAASARRAPRIVTERLQLLGGWVPSVHRIGWQETLLAADDPRDLGALPPDIAALRAAIAKAALMEEQRP